jgi:hypothetical protein
VSSLLHGLPGPGYSAAAPPTQGTEGEGDGAEGHPGGLEASIIGGPEVRKSPMQGQKAPLKAKATRPLFAYKIFGLGSHHVGGLPIFPETKI